MKLPVELESALTFFFQKGEYEIRKKTPTYTAPTPTQFLREFQTVLSSSPKRSTTRKSATSSVQKFMSLLLDTAVGIRISLCDQLLFYIGVAVYAAMAYNMSANYFTLPTSTLVSNIADPVSFLLRMIATHTNTHTMPDIHQRVHDTLTTYINADADSLINRTLAKVVVFMIGSKLYTHLFENLIACALYEMGVESCRNRCNTEQAVMTLQYLRKSKM
jgi:hypothetical protein